MFFDKEMITFDILEVTELKQKRINMVNSGRDFCALSFRYRADTVLRAEDGEYKLRDNSVSFVPADLDYNRTAEVDEFIVVRFTAADCCSDTIESFTPADPSVLGALFRRILDCWNKKAPGYKYRCTSIFYEILAECYSQNFVSEPKGSRIRASLDHIMASFTRHDLTMAEVARCSFMSEIYFRRIFKAEYGVSPWRFIISLRIKHAAELISTGYYTLCEVADMSGYNDYKYFSAEFRRHMGVSPSEYSRNFG